MDKILHECVYAKTLDNITAVKISFENFENVATTEVPSKTAQISQQEAYKLMLQRKSLEPVQEEFIESEEDAPVILPEVRNQQPSPVSKPRPSSSSRNQQFNTITANPLA